MMVAYSKDVANDTLNQCLAKVNLLNANANCELNGILLQCSEIYAFHLEV